MTEDERTTAPLAGDEVATLLGFLDYHRDTVRWKTEGLDAAQLAQRIEPSTMTLGGLLKHLAIVEDWWCSVALLGNEWAADFRDVDWETDEDWDWHSADQDSPQELRALFDRFVAQSQENVRAALDDGGLDRLAARTGHRKQARSLRWILVHLIEEYARHNGHADLIRQSIDGEVGD